MTRVGNPPFPGVLQRARRLVFRAERGRHFLHVAEDGVVDGGEVHVRHRPDAEFADDFGGDDGLGAGGGEGAFDAVEGERGKAPAGHERALLAVRVDGRLVAERLVQVVHGEGDVAVYGAFVVRQRRDHLVDAVDEDPAVVGCDERAHDPHEVGHRLVCRAAVHAAVQVLGRAGHLDAIVAAAAQGVCQAWLLRAEPVVIGDADGVDVGEEGFGVAVDEVVETLRAVLFHAFEAHDQVNW